MDIANQSLVVELQQRIRGGDRLPLMPVGGRTKCLTGLDDQVTCCELVNLRGVVSYDPGEFLISALAGTSIQELAAALSEHGQYLPFDPLFVEAGATLGGTIASGISGPDRLLYGGVRDFVMEVALLDGLGDLVRGGGKVVKNAAGFDIPKMMVGSLGRMGILVEATLKVFPAPQGHATLVIENGSLEQAIHLAAKIQAKPFPIAGLDIDSNHQLSLRLAAPSSSLDGAVSRLQQLIQQESRVLMHHEHEQQRQADRQWLQSLPTEDAVLVRMAVSPDVLVRLSQLLERCMLHDHRHCGGGTLTWAKVYGSQISQLDEGLRELNLSGVAVRGRSNRLFLGQRRWQELASKIQRAIDPSRRFAPWSDENSGSGSRDS
ncbi:MAG: FAD-binding protein [Pirellulaceae bacterium]|nr:FAD-binding protein [Pirellulaceae bacterium]